MALFSSSKHTVFQPTAYGSRRRRGAPRWLMLIITGVVLGAGGVLFVQKSYGPTLLTAEESEKLHHDLNSANLDKQRLQTQVAQYSRELEAARSTLDAQTRELEEAKARAVALEEDIQRFAAAMPPDPRGTSPGIRAADFRNQDGNLTYDVLVMQNQQDSSTPFKGKMQLVVAGRYTGGRNDTVELDPVDFEVGRYQYVAGAAPLPENFIARQVTIRITPADSEKQVAMRIIRVSS